MNENDKARVSAVPRSRRAPAPPPPPGQPVLKARIRELRLSRGLSQETVGAALSLGQSGYADLENGQTTVKRPDLVALAVLYSLPLQEAFPSYEDPLANPLELAQVA